MIMKKRQIGTAVLLASLTANGLLLTGCTNSDYDFNEIDKTMGFGGSELTLPNSSTMQIPLKDILELKENGCIIIEPSDSSYVFYKKGEKTSTANPSVETIKINGNCQPYSLTLISQKGTLKGDGKILTINYSGTKPSSVEELSHAKTECKMTLTTNLSYLRNRGIYTVDKVVLTFPEYMEVKCASGTVSGNVLTLENVSTSSRLNLDIDIVGLDFKKGTGLAISGGNITMAGNVNMALSATASTITAGSATVYNTPAMNPLTVTEATGKFNPDIDIDDLGKVNITGLPDFLSGENVTVDLENPYITLTMNNDMPIGGTLDGIIYSVKDNNTLKAVDFNGVEIAADRKTTALICRSEKEMVHGDGIVVKEVPELSKVIEKIPDYIAFHSEVMADNQTECTFTLGKQYSVSASYEMRSLLSFAENAVIEYDDSFSGWHKDLEDIALADGTYLSLTATAQNKLPLALNIEATPVDVDGMDISSLVDINIKQGKVPASADGKTAAEGTLEIEIREKTSGALKKLDGLSYTFLGKATQDGVSVTGIPLNAKDHTLKLNDIKVKIVGQVIADLN